LCHKGFPRAVPTISSGRGGGAGAAPGRSRARCGHGGGRRLADVAGIREDQKDYRRRGKT
jgi:hypothetical protein